MRASEVYLLKTRDVLKRETLADQVAQQLMEHIQNTAMAPGDQLPLEGEMADMFGISRPVVREALGQLKSIGLVEMHSGRRPMVQPIDGKLPGLFFKLSLALDSGSVQELLEVRRGLEVQSAILAAQRAGEDDCRRLEETVALMKKHLDEKDHRAFIDLDVQLHLLIASASRNAMLYNLIASIRGPMRESIAHGIAARNSQRELQRIHVLHSDVVTAIRMGDGAAAAVAMAAHFDDALISIVADRVAGRPIGGGESDGNANEQD
ncbi:FadR/GntR family transcriptional regulator [Nitratireductor rhodophyticola]|uniref:FadR/GntR family transcriptional regulator n=1 Tax=Nitratireductor rhodophyticola TaxID=2854036 RepID=UPI003BAD88BC